MSVTGKLATSDSILGNLFLGGSAGVVTSPSVSNTITFSQTLSYNRVYDLSIGNTLSVVSKAPDYPKVLIETLVFVGAVHTLREVDVPQVITFVDSPSYDLIRTLSQSLTFSQDVVSGKIFVRSASNTFTISQDVIDRSSKKVVNQTFTLSQALDLDVVFNKSLSDALTLNQYMTLLHLRTASNVLTFSQTADSVSYTGTYGSLTLSQSLGINVDYVLNSNFSLLNLTQVVAAAANRSLSVSNTVTFVQSSSAVRVRFFNVSSTYSPHDNVIPIRIILISQSVSFSQVAVGNSVLNRSVSNTLQLNDSMSRNVVYGRSFSDVYPVVNGYRRPVNLQGTPGNTYVPSVVDPSQSTDYQYVLIPGAMITKVNTFVSFATPGYVLYLKQPDFGDSEANLHKVIEHRTVSGKLYTHVRKLPSRGIKYRFEISRAKAEEARAFILNYLSTPMLMTNWKGEIWYGYITNNPFKLESKRRSMPCDVEDYEMNVEFEGVRIH